MKEPSWSTKIKCPFCHEKHSVKASDVRYSDLRPDFMFVPDMQYFIVCTECSNNLIISGIPSYVSIWIQRNNTTTVESELPPPQGDFVNDIVELDILELENNEN